MEIPAEINDLCYKVRGICMKVHNAIGPGFPEEYYQKALEYEFAKQNIAFEAQKPVQVFYEEVLIGVNFLDFVIDDKIILEIKSVSRLDEVNRFQVLKYIASTNYQIALLINFGQTSIQHERILATKNIQEFRQRKNLNNSQNSHNSQ
jgi:GxxExxY protein